MPPPDTHESPASISSAITRLLDSGETAVLVTLIEAPDHVGAKLLIEASGKHTGTLGSSLLDDSAVTQASTFLESHHETQVYRAQDFLAAQNELGAAQLLFERIQPEARLVICGAGHVGASLANLAAVLGISSTLIDDRAEFVSRSNFADPRIDLVAATNWSDAVTEAIGNGHGVSVAVVTRGHSEDESCLRAIMNCKVDYVGMIGSKRRTKIVLERLRATGISDDQLNLVHAPIGLDIGAITPEEVALAILAEIIAVRRGGGGASLRRKRS